MIIPINNGFIAELELVSSNLFLEVFTPDKAFRVIQPIQVIPVDTVTTSTVTFISERLSNDFQYFVRFFTESGGLFSGETDFLGFVPEPSINILLEDSSFLLLEDGDRLLNEAA